MDIKNYLEGFLAHRLSAALRAISRRRFSDREFALALPPFKPPNQPRATVVEFFSGLARNLTKYRRWLLNLGFYCLSV